MWRRVVLAVSLVAMTQRAIAQDNNVDFGSEEFINAYLRVKGVFQSEFSEELSSCGKNFYSRETVEKEAVCADSQAAANAFCTPECVQYFNFNGIDCMKEVDVVESKAYQRIEESAKDGTMDAKDRKLAEAFFLLFRALGEPVNVTEPGFLSTQDKVKDFFSSEANLEILDKFSPNETKENAFLRGAAACVSPSKFNEETYIKDELQIIEALQSGFSKELPSCGEKFYSVQSVEKVAACLQSRIDPSMSTASDSCTPECQDSVNFKGVDCSTEQIKQGYNFGNRVLDTARNGTMDANDRKLLEAYLLAISSSVPLNGVEPGFLSTQEKANEYFSSEANLQILDDYFKQSMDERDGRIQKATACAEAQWTNDTLPSTSSGYLAKTGCVLLFAAVSVLFLVL